MDRNRDRNGFVIALQRAGLVEFGMAQANAMVLRHVVRSRVPEA